MRSISILGATGSIGASTLDLIRRAPADWRVVALTANSNAEELAKLAREFSAEIAVIADEAHLPALRAALSGTNIQALGGKTGLVEAAGAGADLTIAAIVGCAGLAPTMAAIEQGRIIGLANKEALVSAGEVMTAAVEKYGATLLPVDSEHNAIFQCLAGNDPEHVRTITLTASGGPFRDWSLAQLTAATPAQAVKHPNWDMGAKISVDSATMMNKGLELIEAAHLFPIGLDRIEILVHPQSVIHSMVEFRDRSTLAQLGSPDMRIPIAHALAWPARIATPCQPLDLARIGRLDFETPDPVRFPALRLTRDAAAAGGTAPAILNAANEVAVAAFLDGTIGFLDIAAIVEDVLSRYEVIMPSSMEDVLVADAGARDMARHVMERLTV